MEPQARDTYTPIEQQVTHTDDEQRLDISYCVFTFESHKFYVICWQLRSRHIQWMNLYCSITGTWTIEKEFSDQISKLLWKNTNLIVQFNDVKSQLSSLKGDKNNKIDQITRMQSDIRSKINKIATLLNDRK